MDDISRSLNEMDQELEVAELMTANLAAVQSRYCDGQRLHYKNMEKMVKKMKTIMLHITPEPPPSVLVRTPWWISDFSTLADEVRDRTILVKINSQLHSWSDLEIGYLFSEIGKVDEVKYLPTESGFHSQVRFQNIYDSEWAYYYYNGRFVHQGCCEIELHRPEDVISWNNQRIGEVLLGIRDTLTMANTACLVKESLIEGEMLNQTKGSTQILARKEPNLVNESSVLVAHQVLDKMPRSFVSGELIFLDEVEKINEELVDGLNWKAPPMSSVKELDGVVCVICFDPGGLQQGYVPPSLPKPPAGFVVDDQGRVLMASSKRIVTVVDPTNNLPLECTIRRIFTSSKGAECMLLCPVDMPVEIVKSTSDGWAAVTDEELEAILPTADYALARKHMHLVHRDHAMCLSNKNFESAAGEDNISVDGMVSELRKSYFAADQDTQIAKAAEPVLKIPSMISEKEHKNLKLFEVNDLKHITPLLLVINDFSDFVKCPTEPPAQEVRMVDYIVVCFNVWVFDPGGHLLMHATFGSLDAMGKCWAYDTT